MDSSTLPGPEEKKWSLFFFRSPVNKNTNMPHCANTYPFSPMNQFMPLMQKANGTKHVIPYMDQVAQGYEDGVLMNIDGQRVKFDPCKYRCSLNRNDQVSPVMFQPGQKYTTLGGVVTLPKFYYTNCQGRF
jgi:hypothetical protein